MPKAWRRTASAFGGGGSNPAPPGPVTMVSASPGPSTMIAIVLSGPLSAAVNDTTGWIDPEGNVPNAVAGSMGSTTILMTVTDDSVSGELSYDGTGPTAGIVAPGIVPYNP